MIVTDEEALRIKCEPVTSDEIDDLRKKLLEGLLWSAKRGQPGVGLACPQIGIGKQMAVVRTGGIEIDLVNANIRQGYDQFEFSGEGCLSFPGRFERTLRYNSVVVENNLVYPNQFLITGFAAIVVQHECLPSGVIVITEDGPKRISEIVNNKYSGKVLTVNNNGDQCFSKIIGWSRRRNKNNKQWVRVKTSTTGPNKQLKCTDDHKCAVVTDILSKPVISFIPAKELPGHLIVRRVINRKRNSEHGLYNSDQISAIIGGLLGDLCISSRGEIVITHGKAQAEYATEKAKLFNGSMCTAFSGYKNTWENVLVRAPITEQTKLLRKIVYTGGKNIKGIIKYIDSISLAFWYMDDGCLVRDKNAQIHTEGFSKDDIQLLIEKLNKFGLNPSIYKRTVNGLDRFYLHFSVSDSDRLFTIISPYVYGCMAYKLPERFRSTSKISLSNDRLEYSAKLVSSVNPIKYDSALYDIEVAGQHSFFADDTLVHNCDHLKGVLLPDVALKK